MPKQTFYNFSIQSENWTQESCVYIKLFHVSVKFSKIRYKNDLKAGYIICTNDFRKRLH